MPGETIYELGDVADKVYFVQEGEVSLELYYLVEHTRTCPVRERNPENPQKSIVKISKDTQKIIVKRIVRRLGQGRQFGFEEMIKCWRERIFKAKAIGDKRVELIYLGKTEFLNQLNEKDTRKYDRLCDPYTNIMQDGKNLVSEMNQKKNKLKAFLDGANRNLSDKNFRSQDTDHSWLDYRCFGLKEQRIQKSIRSYLNLIKKRKNRIDAESDDSIRADSKDKVDQQLAKIAVDTYNTQSLSDTSSSLALGSNKVTIDIDELAPSDYN